ncbi:MAG: potassium/proton antiporter [Bacteroidia bacterium]
MEYISEDILLIGSILLFISILAGKTSYRFGVPTLLLFLGIGILAGSEGLGGINFNDPQAAQFIGIVALNFILFSGGLDTKWESIKPILWRGAVLSTLGVLLTTAFVGIFTWYFFKVDLIEGLLLGAIVSSTDAAAVFSVLRSKSVGLKGYLRPTLELESGSNDPMAYFLTITLTALAIGAKTSMLAILPTFILQFALGFGAGIGMGYLGRLLVNKIKLDFEGLYPGLLLAVIFFTYSATEYIGGNGFLAVYICAVYMGNHSLIHKKSLMRFFDGVAWLMQIILFLTLGLLVFPSQIIPIVGIGIVISVFLIFIARPLSVLICLAFFKMKIRNKIFISWVGLRGAVPIVFATYPLIAGLTNADLIFNIVFFITLISVILQGTTIPIMARILKVALPEGVKRRTPLDIELADSIGSELAEVEIAGTSRAAGAKVVSLGFPKKALIVLIKRDGTYISANGATVLLPGDVIVVLAEDEESLQRALDCLN